MMQASHDETVFERKRKRRTRVTVLTPVFVLVAWGVGNGLLRSYRATNQYSGQRSLPSSLFIPPGATSALAPIADRSAMESSGTSTTTTVIIPTNSVIRKPPILSIPTDNEDGSLGFAYVNEEEMRGRRDRFPSVIERVKLYMSNWYTPPCDDYARVAYTYTEEHNDSAGLLNLREIAIPTSKPETLVRFWRINSLFDGSNDHGVFDRVHFVDRDSMVRCKHRYCKDMVEFLFPFLVHTGAAPILYQFGDDNCTRATRLIQTDGERPGLYPNMPVLKKMRKRIRQDELLRLTDSRDCFAHGHRIVPENYHLEPVVFKLKTQRHFGRIYNVAGADVPWENKTNAAAFRGELNGKFPHYLSHKMIRTLPALERCRLVERCWIVHQHADSTLVDAKLTLPHDPNDSKQIPRYLPRSKDIDATVDLYKEKLSMEEMLQYKALIMLEGNDVSSGLKWALFSNSVVLIPEPTLTSWSMEERLEPWVHYIPVDVNGDGTNGGVMTDVEIKMQWVIDNDDEARKIAHAGKLWIADLVLHPDVPNDEDAIFDEIARRYATHFVPATTDIAR